MFTLVNMIRQADISRQDDMTCQVKTTRLVGMTSDPATVCVFIIIDSYFGN